MYREEQAAQLVEAISYALDKRVLALQKELSQVRSNKEYYAKSDREMSDKYYALRDYITKNHPKIYKQFEESK